MPHILTRFWIYPPRPSMNADGERFNRTVQEPFEDEHEDLLFTTIHAFNLKLAEWCVAYNTVMLHPGQGLLAPVPWLLQDHPECQKYWTSTILAHYIVEHYNWPLEKLGFWPPGEPHREASPKRFV
ncbi:integrase core domain-containing protein [Thiofaba sp. EF100]|uniref:integrase core domain-containing protein n=1 Tax=Thiofaba sp. EF100 TaxID=3121274 RepID=UPI0032221EC9